MEKRVRKSEVHREGYSREFKLEAVRLLDSRKKPAELLAVELGVKRSQLYKWQALVRDKGEAAFPGSGAKPLSELTEVERLRRELKQVKLELEILKKADAYFAKLRR
jgi:transposase